MTAARGRARTLPGGAGPAAVGGTRHEGAWTRGGPAPSCKALPVPCGPRWTRRSAPWAVGRPGWLTSRAWSGLGSGIRATRGSCWGAPVWPRSWSEGAGPGCQDVHELSVGYRIAETIPSGWEAIPGTPSPGVTSPRKPLPRWVAVPRWGPQLDSQFTAMGGELFAPAPLGESSSPAPSRDLRARSWEQWEPPL